MSSHYLTALSSSTGERQKIRDNTSIDRTVVQRFEESGLHHYRNNHRTSIIDQASSSVLESLGSFQDEASTIDTVIFSSCSAWQMAQLGVTDWSAFMNSIGLSQSRLIPVCYPSCHHFSLLLDLGRRYLGAHRNVLLVTSDVTESDAQTHRLVEGNRAFLSDGAASAILTSSPMGFEIHENTLKSEHALAAQKTDTPKALQLRSIEVVSRIVSHLNARLSAIDLSAFQRIHLITNNYGKEYLEFLRLPAITDNLDITLAQSNLREMGHMFSADNFIHIQEIARQQPGAQRDLVIAISSGEFSWGVSILSRTAED